MRDKVRTHKRLAALAARQYGVVSSQQLQRLGYSRSAISRATGAGRLHAIHRGVYAVGHARLCSQGLCLAAVLTCGRGAALSHRSAAWAWGLLPRLSTPIEISVPRRGHRRGGLHLHWAPALTDEDRTVRDAIPATALPRTLLDLAATVPGERLERAIERSEQLGLFDLRAADSLLARTTGHPGAGRLRQALNLYREPAFTRSALEDRFLRLVREAGLPMPSANVFVAGRELDMYWAPERFAVELDGYEYHRTRAAFERDRLRQEELKLAGIEMIRLTARRIARDPQGVMERLGMLMAQRRHELEDRGRRGLGGEMRSG